MTPRELGSIYTPRSIAHRIVGACLERWSSTTRTASHQSQGQCRVLDPACGDGAFLLEIFDELCRRYSDETGTQLQALDRAGLGDGPEFRLHVVRNHLFGADIDPPAVAALQARLLERISATGELAALARAVVESNIRCGDSLAGSDFSPKNGRQPAFGSPISSEVPEPLSAIDWRRDFPAAAAAGGFDVVVGNPPYLRERNAKPLFDSLAITDLGRQWREARMDLWYYFVHRSLDLLRPGGILSFIVNSYWMSSRGASRLIDRLECETTFEEIELFSNAVVFKAVAGRHMIFRLHKRDLSPTKQPHTDGRAGQTCRIVISPRPATGRPRKNAKPSTEERLKEYAVPLAELFQNGRLVVAPADPAQSVFQNRSMLGEHFGTRQGMAENPPAINCRLAREFPGHYTIGEGVFVLHAEEIERLHLSAAEKTLLRPYYETTAIGRYRIVDEPTHAVLYLTHRTAPRLDDLPNIAAHLERFRPILERRRETRAGKCAWWCLHWPRAEEIFNCPRILSVQMGERPQFAFPEHPTYVGFSINLILTGPTSGVSLDALTAILNSDLAQSWFERHAKRRGVHLEINAHLLQQFPLPGRDESVELRLGNLVRARQRAAESDCDDIESEIEESVRQLYSHPAMQPSNPSGRG